MSGWPHPRRLYAPELPISESELELRDESLKHAQVLRLRAGTDVELFDAAGHIASATLTSISARGATCQVAARRHLAAAAPAVHLILGLPKADKLDNVVRMLTELGVTSIHIALCERSIPKPREENAGVRLERLERIAREACAQSGQAYAPIVHAPAKLAEVAARAAHAGAQTVLRWVLWEESSAPRSVLDPAPRAPEQMWVVVGPEGGLTAQEVEELAHEGYAQVSLGSAILRFETAAITAAVLALEHVQRLAPAAT